MPFNPTRWQIRAPAELGRRLEAAAALEDIEPDEYVRKAVEERLGGKIDQHDSLLGNYKGPHSF